MKKTPLELLNNREIALPTKSSIKTVRFLLKLMQSSSDVEYKYSFDTKKMMGEQVILLADHATKDAYKYVLHGYPFSNPNVVVGYQNIFVKGLFKLLLKGGIIPKKLYQADQKALIEMLKILNMGGSLCVFPEGIQSTSGSTHPIFTGTAKLLKKAKVTVVLCKSYGSYLVRPRYKTANNKGHQEYHYEILFTKEELEVLTVEEIYTKLLNRFTFNDFTWNKTAKYKYFSKKDYLATGLNYILYHCPKCNGEFTLKTDKNNLVCEKCGNNLVLNEYYDLLPNSPKDYMPYSSIDEWYKHQRKLVQEEVKKPFKYEYECDICDLHTEKLCKEKFYKCGEGVVTITNDSIRYVGTRHGQEVDLVLDMKGIPSFTFTPNKNNYLYYDNLVYCFKPKKDILKVVKYMLLVEESNRLLSDSWNKVCKDVYEI